MAILTLDNPQFDDVATEYYEDIEALARRALAGDMSQAEYRQQHEELTMAVLLALFLLAGADANTPEARRFLSEQRQIARESAEKLARDLFDGRYSEYDGQTAEQGLAHLEERLELWTYTAGQVYQRGVIGAVPVDGREKTYGWALGRTEKHCGTCLDMSGQELTQTQWQALAADGIAPQGHGLACKGFRCDCFYREVR